MNLKQRIEAFAATGAFLNRHYNGGRITAEAAIHEGLDKVIETAGTYNNWFIPKYVNEAVFNIGAYLQEEELIDFAAPFNNEEKDYTVAVICAGNIPLVCFHDVLCVLLSGNKILLKLSSDDNVLLPFLLKLLCHYEPAFESRIFFAEGKLTNFMAIIATGSNNTAGHLHYYFGKFPNIIRKSRTSLAVLTGHESTDDLKNLGSDIFTYFGLGCRNVSKLLVPEGYAFDKFFESIVGYSDVVNNKKYGNNYDYYRSIYLLEKMKFLDNNFLMLKESADLYSPVGVVYYQYYNSEEEANKYINGNREHLQCIVAKEFVPFGYSQRPVISNFADNINTVNFLVNLHGAA